jgi:16S rRNA (guanine527-N7)-methyltransferase
MKDLKDALQTLGLDSSEGTLGKFQRYMDMVLSWNEKVNLTAIKDRDDFIKMHFIDSLCAAAHEPYAEAASVIDVGTGAGFPGLPLAIVSPEKNFLLIDSLNKRIKILNEIIAELGLTNVTAVHGRAEELARKKEYREGFDICVSRAVSNLAVLSEYCLPFIKVGGYLAAYKGPDAAREVAESGRAFKVLGGAIDQIRDTDMQKFGIEHRIVYVKKVASTPKAYPRKAGTPERKPL